VWINCGNGGLDYSEVLINNLVYQFINIGYRVSGVIDGSWGVGNGKKGWFTLHASISFIRFGLIKFITLNNSKTLARPIGLFVVCFFFFFFCDIYRVSRTRPSLLTTLDV